MDILHELHTRFSFLIDEYDFEYHGIQELTYIAYILPYNKNKIGIKIYFEQPDIIDIYIVDLRMLHKEWWSEVGVRMASDYLENVLMKHNDIDYLGLRENIRTIYEKIRKIGFGHGYIKDMYIDDLLNIYVYLIHVYLDRYYPNT